MSAPIFKRIAEAAIQYLGVPASINPAAPVLVARHDPEAETPTAQPQRAEQPVISLVADGGPGTVPDLRGLSARDAMRRLVNLGITGRFAGDGFVASQEPAAGTPVEPGMTCRLQLNRAAYVGRP